MGPSLMRRGMLFLSQATRVSADADKTARLEARVDGWTPVVEATVDGWTPVVVEGVDGKTIGVDAGLDGITP